MSVISHLNHPLNKRLQVSYLFAGRFNNGIYMVEILPSRAIDWYLCRSNWKGSFVGRWGQGGSKNWRGCTRFCQGHLKKVRKTCRMFLYSSPPPLQKYILNICNQPPWNENHCTVAAPLWSLVLRFIRAWNLVSCIQPITALPSLINTKNKL